MDNKQKKIDEKILRIREELKLLQNQRAELVRKEKEKAKREKERWYAELSRQIDAVLCEKIGADFRSFITQDEIIKMLLAGLQQGGEVYGSKSGNATY